MNVATNLSKALEINITLIRDNLGGYKNKQSIQLRELSYTIEFDEVDAESAKLFASLLSDLGYQVQESVYSLSYTKEEVKEYTGIEAFIKCDTSDRHKVAQTLEDLGIENYSITSEGVKLLAFVNKEQAEEVQKVTDKQSLTKEAADNLNTYTTFVEQYKNAINQLSGQLQLTKFHSDYLDADARQTLYKQTLNKLNNEQISNSNSLRGQGEVLGSPEENRGSTSGSQWRLRDYINEALTNLQSFQQGQRGKDLTNDLQNGEEEYTLNTPLTPTQFARSQLDAEGDSMSSEEDRAIQQQQKTFLEQSSNLLTTTVLTQAQILNFSKDLGK